MRGEYSAAMTEDARRDRTARMLAWRLEELAGTLERRGTPTRDATRQLELAVIATDHAVELDLLSREDASEIWRAAAGRHPVLRAAS
jgi:hypothetical protein